jgi:hypothetical protein
MPHYVEVIGPYDGVFVGPFETVLDAAVYKEEFIHAKGNVVFDLYVITQAEMDKSIAEYGPIPLQAPDWEA